MGTTVENVAAMWQVGMALFLTISLQKKRMVHKNIKVIVAMLICDTRREKGKMCPASPPPETTRKRKDKKVRLSSWRTLHHTYYTLLVNSLLGSRKNAAFGSYP